MLATTQFSQVHDLLKAGSTRGTPVAIAALSFVNPDELAESVGAEARGTVVSQVIPSPRPSNQVSVPVIRECAEALAAHSGAKLNYTTLESCIAAKALVEVRGGLADGDLVVARAGTFLRDGDTVRPVPGETAAKAEAD